MMCLWMTLTLLVLLSERLYNMAFVHKEPSAAERALGRRITDGTQCIACGRVSNNVPMEMRRLGNGEVHPLCIDPRDCRINGGWPPMESDHV